MEVKQWNDPMNNIELKCQCMERQRWLIVVSDVVVRLRWLRWSHNTECVFFFPHFFCVGLFANRKILGQQIMPCGQHKAISIIIVLIFDKMEKQKSTKNATRKSLVATQAYAIKINYTIYRYVNKLSKVTVCWPIKWFHCRTSVRHTAIISIKTIFNAANSQI